MKKTKSLLLLIIVLLMSLCCVMLSACKDTQDQNDTVSVLFKNGETVQTLSVDITDFDDTSSIYDLFVSAKEKSVINAVIENENTDMAYLQGVYGILANNNNYEYIAIYTDIATLTDNTGLTITVNEIDFYYSNVGIKDLVLQKDAHYLFNLEQWTTQQAVDLNNARTAAKAELDSYVNAGDYRAAEQTTLATAIANGKTAIDTAADTATVSTALANAKTVIDGIKTDAELTADEAALELLTAKTNAKNSLDNYVNASDYRTAEQETLATAIANGKTAIDNTVDTNAVSTALANAKTIIDGIKTDAELTAEESALALLTAKTDAKNSLDSYVNTSDYRTAEQETLATAIANGKTAIDNAVDTATVSTALTNAKATIDGIKTDAELTADEALIELSTAKTDAKNSLDSYVNSSDYRTAEQETLATAIANGKTAIDNAVDTTAVSTALANAKTIIDGIKTDTELTVEENLATAKTNAKNSLDSYVNASDYRTAEQQTLATVIANGKAAIDNAVDITAVSTALTNAKTAIDGIKTNEELTAEEALAAAKSNAKAEINTYKALPANDVNQFDGFEAAENTFTVIYEQIDDSIDNAATVSAVNSAVTDAKTLIDGLIITVKCTFTNDGEFLFTNNNSAIANMTVIVPYFDLAEYDLSQFYRYEAESYENGGAYIGDEVLLQPTVMHAFIYMHVMYSENGIDDYTVTGSSCSSYMSQFWKMDENLNYYVDYKYPLMAAGWGSTSDYILLEDDMHVDVAHWSNWGFWSSGVKFVYTDTDTYDVSVGEQINFDFKYWASDMMNPDPVETEANIAWLAGTVYAEGDDLSLILNQCDVTDSDTDGVLDYTFETAGTYYIVFRDVDIVGGCDVENDIQYYVGNYVVKVVVK